MKIELKSREGSVYKKLCSSVSEANSDTELIVPDSLEDILRILSCRRQCRIREKNVGQDAVSVSGEIDVTVMYIPETGDGVRVVGTTVPFEISFSAPGADSTSSAVTKLLALTADAKAVNPRKISITTSTVMELSCYKYSDMCWFEPPESVPDKLFFKTSELKCKSIVLVSEKTLSVEDELEAPEQLSGGEQQRVALARALVNNPSMIIADEPTGNIDPAMSFEIVELLSEINKCGTTVIMVTHEHELVSRFRHRTVVIDRGRVVADGKIGGKRARQ